MKGSAARFRHAYVKGEYGEAAWQDVLEALTAEERAGVAAAERGEMIPVAIEGRILEQIAAQRFGGDRTKAAAEFRRAGGMQADDMLDGVFSIFARFVSPQQAFLRGGSILGSVYDGIEVETVGRDEDLGGVIRIKGLRDFSYCSPWISGWIERAIERFGGHESSVREVSWQRGETASDVLEFEVRWK